MSRCAWEFAALLGLIAALGSAGCSLIIEDDTRVPCSVNADLGLPDPCGEGQSCIEGYCGACSANPEVCNASDDDCDGLIDEGIVRFDELCNGIDDDCDGEIDEELSELPDLCNARDDDCDGEIDEGAAEVCDGVDNNCDGDVDEETEGPLCPDTQVCYAGQCAERSCANILECDEGEVCDLETTSCVNAVECLTDADCSGKQRCSQQERTCVSSGGLGERCQVHFDCDVGLICDGGGAEKFCTTACCATSDCQPGFTCATSDYRNNHLICVPITEEAAREDQPCNYNSDCASGVCLSSGCAALCRGGACGAGKECIGFVDGQGDAAGSFCGDPAGGGRGPGGACGPWEWYCALRLCDTVSGSLACVETCRNDLDCPSDQSCGLWEYDSGAHSTICVASDDAHRRAGQPCTEDGQCASAGCSVEGTCDRLCCSNAQCGFGEVCVPGTNRAVCERHIR